MSERYNRIYTYSDNRVFQHPTDIISVEKGAILHDTSENEKICQIMFRNNSSKSISSLTVRIHTYDITGTKSRTVQETDYEGIFAAPSATFGSDMPIILEDGNSAAFALEFISVAFSDGSSWSRNAAVASDMAENVIKTTAKVAKTTVKITNVIGNIIWSFFMLCLCIIGIPQNFTGEFADVVIMLYFIFVTVVTFPFFNKVIFKKKYGALQRLIRWIGLPVLGFIVARLIIIIAG